MLIFSSAVKRLCSVPPEIVHKILEDFQLSRILHLICAHDLPYLDSCIAAHSQIGKILPYDRLEEIKAFFTLYLDLLNLQRHPGLQYPHIPALECDAVIFAKRGGTPADVIYHTTSAILIKLTHFDSFRDALQPHVSELLPSLYQIHTTDIASLRHFFDAMLNAEMTLNKEKSDQLKRLAQLIKVYPRSLKRINDPSQELRRNEQHIIDQLLVLSEKMLRPQILDKDFVAKGIFGIHNLILVPYDRLLRGFLKTIHRFPTTKHTYPPEMTTVLEGISHVSLRLSCRSEKSEEDSEITVFERTKFTPYSSEFAKKRGGQQQPQFANEHGKSGFKHVHDRIQPIDDSELEWLESFLKVCRYMSQMEEKWKADMSVSDYWKKHFD